GRTDRRAAWRRPDRHRAAQPAAGAPHTYVTTPSFQTRWGLPSPRDLPDLARLQDASLLGKAPLPDELHAAMSVCAGGSRVTLNPRAPEAAAEAAVLRSRLCVSRLRSSTRRSTPALADPKMKAPHRSGRDGAAIVAHGLR